MKRLPLVLLASLLFTTACELMPRNTLKDCRSQCEESDKPNACYDFCDCIHEKCQPLDKCLATYNQAPKQKPPSP